MENANTKTELTETLSPNSYEDEPISKAYIPLRSKEEFDKLVESMLMWW